MALVLAPVLEVQLAVQMQGRLRQDQVGMAGGWFAGKDFDAPYWYVEDVAIRSHQEEVSALVKWCASANYCALVSCYALVSYCASVSFAASLQDVVYVLIQVETEDVQVRALHQIEDASRSSLRIVVLVSKTHPHLQALEAEH